MEHLTFCAFGSRLKAKFLQSLKKGDIFLHLQLAEKLQES